MSRSTWACELKWQNSQFLTVNTCHAPRERVSWNCAKCSRRWKWPVTLHVSVWVEICEHGKRYWQKRSRSTWACELKYRIIHLLKFRLFVTLHVSVWVEIVWMLKNRKTVFSSRSTWACELKLYLYYIGKILYCHAPRERVSWNILPIA